MPQVPERGMDAAVEVMMSIPQDDCGVFNDQSNSNHSVDSAIWWCAHSGQPRQWKCCRAAPGDSTFSQSQSQLDASRINAAKGKGRAAHQSIQSGGTASPRADGYGSMNTAEKEAYKSGFRGE